MKEFDIENFPISRTALDMLHSMPEDFYKDSYVMKWLLQVTGTEWDSIKDIIEGLPLQFFPETATWGLIYHEQKWQLPVKYNLGYGERRKLIYQRRDFKAPMTPYKMELYIEKILGIETHITDCHDPGERGYMPGHPNIFKAIFITENTLDVAAVSAVLNKLKQSHTVYTLEDLIQIIINNCEKFLFISIDFRFIVPFWGCKLVNGTKLLDGSGLINASRRYNLVLGVKNNIKAYIKENIYTGRLYIKILPCYNVHENINGLKTVFRLGSCWFFIFSNGKQDIPLSVTMPVHASIAQEINIARLVINGIEVHTEEKTGAASVLRAAINSLPVKPGLPLKTGFVSQINTSQNIDISNLINNGMEVYTEEKAGAASGLKAGINHYKTPGGTRAVPARTWHKAAVVIHESIQGFTVIPEEVTCTIVHNNTILGHCSMVINGQNFDNTSDYLVKGFGGKDNTVTIVFTPDNRPVYKFTDNTKPSLQSQEARLVSTTVNGDGTAEMVIAFNSNAVCIISARPLYTVRRFTVSNTDANISINVYVDGMSIGTRIRKSEGSFTFNARTGQSVTFDATPDDGYILKDNGFYVVTTYKTYKLSEALMVTEDIFKEDVKTLIYVTPLAELKKYNVNIEYLDNSENIDAYVRVAGASGTIMQAGTNKTFSISHGQVLSVGFDCHNNSLKSTPSILICNDNGNDYEIFLDYDEAEWIWYAEYVVISDSPIWICLNN